VPDDRSTERRAGKRELAPPIFRAPGEAFFPAILTLNHRPFEVDAKKPERFHSGFLKFRSR
jgi:hypothetical protein